MSFVRTAARVSYGCMPSEGIDRRECVVREGAFGHSRVQWRPRRLGAWAGGLWSGGLRGAEGSAAQVAPGGQGVVGCGAGDGQSGLVLRQGLGGLGSDGMGDNPMLVTRGTVRVLVLLQSW